MKFIYDSALNYDLIREIFQRRFPEYKTAKYCGWPKLKKNIFHQALVTIEYDKSKDGQKISTKVYVSEYSSSIWPCLMGIIPYYVIQYFGQAAFMQDVTNVIEEELTQRFHRIDASK